MKKKIAIFLCGIWLLCLVTACANNRNLQVIPTTGAASEPATQAAEQDLAPPQMEQRQTEEQKDRIAMQMTIGEHTFTARLYDTEAAQVFAERLPITLEMDELNGNEKFNYLAEKLPTESEQPSEIHMGELMLYGSDCLVLFYEDFSTTYSYTRIGYMEDTSGLIEALGSGSVQVKFDFI